MRAGLTTFFAMAYIISVRAARLYTHLLLRCLLFKVNATILADSGGTCVCNDPVDPLCDNNVEYNLCLNVIRRDLITATAAISALSSFAMGLFANMPIALAPGSA